MRHKLLQLLPLVFPVLVAGCAEQATYIPVTDGFQMQPGAKITRTIVWGGHPSATGTAITWLQRHRVKVIERVRLQQLFDEQNIRLMHSSEDDAQVLKVGRMIGAGVAVFVDTPVTTGSHMVSDAFAYRGIGSASTKGSTVHSTSVWVRGVDVETSEVLWSGTARYPETFDANLDDILAGLTCHALATAWGLRPVGQYEFDEDMCTLNKRLEAPSSIFGSFQTRKISN